jgi:hypothetical protein
MHRYNGRYAHLPNRTLGDVRLTSEYVVSFINRMYSTTFKNAIDVIGHSQGNLNKQQALNFWPSRRTKVAAFVSHVGDFQATSESTLIDVVKKIVVQGANPNYLQQSILLDRQAAYLRALNRHRHGALVHTVSTLTLGRVASHFGTSTTSTTPLSCCVHDLHDYCARQVGYGCACIAHFGPG